MEEQANTIDELFEDLKILMLSNIDNKLWHATHMLNEIALLKSTSQAEAAKFLGISEKTVRNYKKLRDFNKGEVDNHISELKLDSMVQ